MISRGDKLEHKRFGTIGTATGEISGHISCVYFEVEINGMPHTAWWLSEDINVLTEPKVIKCDCGGHITKEPHYTWCSVNQS
jgi:hypothetical protein